MSCLILVWVAFLSSSAEALHMEGCQRDSNGGASYINVVHGSNATAVYCKGLRSWQDVVWTVDGRRVGRCPNPRPSPLGRKINSCYHQYLRPRFVPFRHNSEEAYLTMDSSLSGLMDLKRVECRSGRESASCGINYVYPAETPGCWVEVSRWKVEGRCLITKVFSSRHRYTCRWFHELDGVHYPNISVSTKMNLESDPSSPPYLKGTCVATLPQFPVQHLGRSNFTVGFKVRLTGNTTVRALAVGDNVIERPRVPTIWCEPSSGHVSDVRHLNCSCRTQSLGRPSGRLVWWQMRIGEGGFMRNRIAMGSYGSLSLPLKGDKVHSHNGSVLGCDVVWAVNMQGPNFTVWIGDSSKHKPRPTVTLETNGRHVNSMTVEEGDAITFRCKVRAEAVTLTLTLTYKRLASARDEKGEEVGLQQRRLKQTRGSGVLEYLAAYAGCSDTGRYACQLTDPDGSIMTSSSSDVYVRCKPRTDSRNVVVTGGATVTIDVIAYPVPTFAYFMPLITESSGGGKRVEGEDGEGEEEEEVDQGQGGLVSGKCEEAEEVYVFSCSARASLLARRGSYLMIISNDAGFTRMTVRVSQGSETTDKATVRRIGTTHSPVTVDNTATSTAGPEDEGEGSGPATPLVKSWVVVVVVVVVMLVVLALVAVTVVVVVCRRRRNGGRKELQENQPPTPDSDQDPSFAVYSPGPSELYLYPSATFQSSGAAACDGDCYVDAGSDAHIYMEVKDYENCEHSEGHYERLHAPDVGQRSVYSQLNLKK